MNKNIVYCLCSYLKKDNIIEHNLKPVVNDLKAWSENKGADFKLITKIPDIIEDMFGSIINFYKDKQIQKYTCIKKADCNFNLQQRFKTLFELTNTSNIKYLDEYLLNLKKTAGLEDNFKKLGINIEKDYSKILSGVNTQRLSNNPIQLKKNDIKNILFKKMYF